jgi:hypothetical protein
MESSMGSTSFLVLLATLTMITNLLFASLCYFLYFSDFASQAVFWSSQGFWTVLFSLITIDCMLVPDSSRRLMFVPVDIPSKWFPLALLALLALFSGGDAPLTLAYLTAIGVGYLHSQGWLQRLSPTSYQMEQWEGVGGGFHTLSRYNGYVLAASALGGCPLSPPPLSLSLSF